MRPTRHIIFLLLIAVLAMLSCHRERTSRRGLSEEAYLRLKAVGDSVNRQSPRARALIDSALANSADSLTYYDYYVELGRLYMLQQPDSVPACASRIMAFAQRQKESARINGMKAEAYHLNASYNYLYHQNHEEAIKDNIQAYKLFLNSDMKDNAASICANIGDIYMFQSLLPEAAAWYRRALVVTDSLQLPDDDTYTFYMGLGQIYCILQDYKLSEEYYEKARKGYDRMQANMKITFLNNYGNLKYYKQEYGEALRSFISLDSLINGYGLKGGFDDYLCQLNMADVLLNLGRNEESMQRLEPADSFFKANGVGDAIYYANTIRMGNALSKGDIATVRQIIANEARGLTANEDMISIRNRYLHDYYVKVNDLTRAIQIERDNNRRRDSIDLSREHMRSSDIMTRLMVDTLTLHNELRLNAKNAEISQARLRYLLIISGILLAALALLAWTLFLRKRNADNQLEIIRLKISNDRNVIAPHFIFNVLKHASTQEKKEANETISGIITLMRSQLNVSRRVMVTLREELDFTEHYVKVAAVSMGPDFTFHIHRPGDETEDSRLVPSTFVQILVENAIKHALKPLEGEKILTIHATVNPHETTIEVEDNGLGFDIRRQSSDGTGTGLRVIRRTLALYNESHRHKILFAIRNITRDDGSIAGCRASLTLPDDVKP